MRRDVLKGQADVTSACLPLSYEVLLIDKNEFIVYGRISPVKGTHPHSLLPSWFMLTPVLVTLR